MVNSHTSLAIYIDNFIGILNNPNIKEQVVLLARRIKDGESIREDGALRKFIDASFNTPVPLVNFQPPPGPPLPKPPSSALSLDCEATSLLGHLKDHVSSLIPPSALLDYVVDKRHLGSEKEDVVAPGEKIAEVAAGQLKKGEAEERYIREMCEVACKSLGDHILAGFKKSNLATPAVFQEVTLHHAFLKIKLRGYVERSKLQVTEYNLQAKYLIISNVILRIVYCRTARKKKQTKARL
jgi:hypothetical protein